MQRRTLLKGLAALSLLGAAVRAPAQSAAKQNAGVAELQNNWKSLLAADAVIAADAAPLKLADAEWKKRLDPLAYQVLRHEGTEHPGSSPLDHEKRPGVFACAGCGLPLFSSAMKFDSGTGWPSFFTTIPGAFQTSTDHILFVARTEYHCVKCGGHHGHVFDDGPQPTGLRYCNNGVALRFIPKSGKV